MDTQLLKKRLMEISAGVHAGPQAKHITVAALLDDLIADFETNEKSVDWVRFVEGHLRPFFGHMRAERVESRHIDAYIKERREAGISNSTINRELARLRRAFNLARESCPPKVKRGLKIPKLVEPPPRKGFFEHADFVVLRTELPEHLRPVLTFGYYTGCRKGEILNLVWPQVDLLERIVRLEPGETKNEEARTIPLMDDLYEMLVLQKQKRDQHWPRCRWVFFRYGKKIKDFRGAWDEACKRADLWDYETGRTTRVFHDLRRTGVRNLVRAGVPERVAMMISGHKTRSVFDRYNIVSERDLHDAAAKLGQHMKELEKARDKHNSSTIQQVANGKARKLLN